MAARLIPLLLILFLAGCSSGLLDKDDYQSSLRNFYHGDIDSALATFPEGENATFITTMEKSYLHLLAGDPEISELETFADIIDQRVRYWVTREVQSLFYAETPEGYYASEHEIIWLHLLLSWGYSLQGRYEKGCVEARKSSDLLSSPWSEEGNFDDPMLRIILAGLWSMCGSWEDAQIDFRAAAKLDPTLVWAEELADRDIPPRHLIILLGGVGPEPHWAPSLSSNPLRGARELTFNPQGRRSQPVIIDARNLPIELHPSPDSAYWYKRHLVRDNAIHDLIKDSRYGQNVITTTGTEGAKISIAVATGIGIGVASTTAGYLILTNWEYLKSAELMAIGLAIPLIGTQYGYKLAKRSIDDSTESAKEKLNPAGNYRFVRFLPEYAFVGWGDTAVTLPLSIEENPINATLVPSGSHKTPDTIIAHYPDVDRFSVGETLWFTPQERWQSWINGVKKSLSRRESVEGEWKELKSKINFIHKSNTNSLGISTRQTWVSPGVSPDLKVSLDDMNILATIPRGIFETSQKITIDSVAISIEPLTDDFSDFLEIPPDVFTESLLEAFSLRIELIEKEIEAKKSRKLFNW